MKTIPGPDYHRALAYAFVACPKGKNAKQLQHVVFIGDMIVAGDSERRHIGIVPKATFRPMAITRSNALELLAWLEAVRRSASRKDISWEVAHDTDGCVYIRFGGQEVAHEIERASVGEFPKEWEPVKVKGGVVPRLRRRHQTDVGARKSWEDDRLITTAVYDGGPTFVRVDSTLLDDVVKIALLVPVGVPPAILPMDAGLWRDRTGRFGQSVLDLHIDVNAKPAPVPAADVKAELVEKGAKKKRGGKKKKGEPAADEFEDDGADAEI